MSHARVAIALAVLLVTGCSSKGHAAATPPVTPPALAAASMPTPAPALTPPGTGGDWYRPRFDAIAFRSPAEGWAVVLGRSKGGMAVVHTIDGGAHWSSPSAVTSSWAGAYSVEIRFADRLHGWVFGRDLYATRDGGQSWQRERNVDPFASDVEPAGGSVWMIDECGSTGAACADSPRLYASTIGESTWTLVATRLLKPNQLHMIRLSREEVIIWSPVSELRTRDGGRSWASMPLPCPGWEGADPGALATLDGKVQWVVCGSQPGAGSQVKTAYISDDSGLSWSYRAGGWDHPAGDLSEGGYVYQLALASPANAFLALQRGGLLRSVDVGRTWRPTPVADEAGAGVHDPWFVDAYHGWVADTDGLWRTVDGGATWKLVAASPEPS